MATSATLAPNQVEGIQRSGAGAADESALLEGTRLETWDIVVIVAYFVIVLGFGLWVSFTYRSLDSSLPSLFINVISRPPTQKYRHTLPVPM